MRLILASAVPITEVAAGLRRRITNELNNELLDRSKLPADGFAQVAALQLQTHELASEEWDLRDLPFGVDDLSRRPAGASFQTSRLRLSSFSYVLIPRGR